MSDSIATFAYDTLIWTAVLIAAVLVLRRPVARYFGPQAAYALWLLPFLRLVLPPIVLPASWQPQALTSVPEAEAVGAGSVPSSAADALAVMPVEPAAPALPFDLTTVTLAIWLTGAAVFLAVRYRGYFTMRRELLRDARCVGQTEGVRLLESNRTQAPLAFGVIEKIVMLPEGFMAQYDLTVRNLALEHELAHHRGRDLLANFVAQPLFALHWFNPLAHLAWRAMRRDQEAACDARVMAARFGEDRAAYANVIAGFAAGANLSLAAPMACPVLGEKSIIHRLRSLNMSDISPRRRLMGRGLIAAAAIALPLTASISYAEGTAPQAPDVPAPPAPPAAPLAPLAPTAPVAPAAPLAPDAPEAGPAPGTAENVWVTEDEDADGRKIRKEIRMVHGDRKMTAEERAEFEAEMADMHRELADARKEIDEALREGVEVHRIAMKDMDGPVTVVETNCKGDEGLVTQGKEGGKKVIRICKAQIMAHALNGLKEARKAIASNTDMPSDARAEALKELDSEIANWDK